jgi:UDP-galactose transporter B1
MLPRWLASLTSLPIPFMIVGVLEGKKMYSLLKYLFTLMIVVGVALFMYKDKAGKAPGGSDSLVVGVGKVLLLVYLTCNSQKAVQEWMKHHPKSGLMMAMQKCSVDYLSAAQTFTREGLEFLGFIQRHPADTHGEC